VSLVYIITVQEIRSVHLFYHVQLSCIADWIPNLIPFSRHSKTLVLEDWCYWEIKKNGMI